MDLCISVHQILSLVQPDNGSSCGTLRNIFGILTIHHLILYIYTVEGQLSECQSSETLII